MAPIETMVIKLISKLKINRKQQQQQKTQKEKQS